MTLKVYILKGLPASGKTTWARQLVDTNPGIYVRVNKDDLREMAHNANYSKHNEKLILRIRDKIILESLRAGRHVIVDDTNLHPKHIQDIQKILDYHHCFEDLKEIHRAEIIEKFFKVDVDEAIKRDLQREKSVGEKVIRDMYDRYLKRDEERPSLHVDLSSALPPAIICDLDGTLADNSHRSPYDASTADQDKVNESVESLLRLIMTSHDGDNLDINIIFLSGRDSKYREVTNRFLKKIRWLHQGPSGNFSLYMRVEGDTRKDYIVKKELYEQHIKQRYNVLFWLDDRNQVVDMVRKELSLPCFQVNYGDF